MGRPSGIALAPGEFHFGTVAVGTASLPVTLTLRNQGSAPSGALGAASLGGAGAAEFAIDDDGCVGRTLDPGASCALAAHLEPTTAGTPSATLSVSAQPGGTASTTLRGRAVAPGALSVEPSPHDYLGVLLGGASDQGFTVRNGGAAASGSLTLALDGSNAGQYQILDGDDLCSGQSLAPGAACTATVRFAPTAPASQPVTLTAEAAPGGVGIAMLTGIGLRPAALALAPSPYDFGLVDAGSSSARSFTVTNSGDQPTAQLGPPSLEGDASFTLEAEDCSGVVLLGNAANACSITVRHAPPASETRAATLGLSASPGGSASVSLTRTGRRSVSPSPSRRPAPAPCNRPRRWATSTAARSARPRTSSPRRRRR